MASFLPSPSIFKKRGFQYPIKGSSYFYKEKAARLMRYRFPFLAEE